MHKLNQVKNKRRLWKRFYKKESINLNFSKHQNSKIGFKKIKFINNLKDKIGTETLIIA